MHAVDGSAVGRGGLRRIGIAVHVANGTTKCWGCWGDPGEGLLNQAIPGRIGDWIAPGGRRFESG